jgi:hypothetical protein
VRDTALSVCNRIDSDLTTRLISEDRTPEEILLCVELAMQVKPQQQQQQATKRDPNSLTLAELGREQVDFAAFGGMSGFGEKFDKEFARGESIGRMLLAKVGSVPSAHGGSNEAA